LAVADGGFQWHLTAITDAEQNVSQVPHICALWVYESDVAVKSR
jgi:hypothetical protein